MKEMRDLEIEVENLLASAYSSEKDFQVCVGKSLELSSRVSFQINSFGKDLTAPILMNALQAQSRMLRQISSLQKRINEIQQRK